MHIQHIKKILTGISIFFIGITFMSCRTMSEEVTDPTAGINGSFETVQNGLPVNWLMYTPSTVPNADFRIELDKQIYKEGTQSLKFDVKQCESTGGWGSPGFTNEFTVAGQFKGDATYKVSFWIKNNGTKFSISAGGVKYMKEGTWETLIESDETIEDWKLLEFMVPVPDETHLRMELSILEPGTLWIDDVRIEKV